MKMFFLLFLFFDSTVGVNMQAPQHFPQTRCQSMQGPMDFSPRFFPPAFE